MTFPGLKALTFDVFGTVVDLRGTLADRAARLVGSWGVAGDWRTLTDDWLVRYRRAIEDINAGARDWTHSDAIVAESLARALEGARIALSGPQEGQLTALWGRLTPWPDARPGLARLRSRYLVAALSNGTVATMAAIAREGGLRWDTILSAGLVRAYKPQSLVYRMALDGLGLRPEEVMMVASHRYDLDAAHREGLKTAFIDRPGELSGEGTTPPDVVCPTIEALATILES